MAAVNRAIIVGNLGADPELRYTQNQTAVATLNIATTETRTDANGEKQEQTEWHRIVVWGRQAENCSKFLAKGRQVYVEGRLQTRSWDDKDGVKRYTTEIVAQNVQFLGGAKQESGPGASYQNRSSEGPSHSSSNSNARPYDARHMPSDDSFGSISSPAIDEIPF